jgi:hypothetical protein
MRLLDDLMPTEAWAIPAWVGCLMWAIGNKDILEQFRADTGCTWAPGKTQIERMIDEATGYDADFIRRFAIWHNKSIWGEVNGRACNGNEPESDFS